VLKHKAQTVVAKPNPVILAGSFEAFEVGNLLESLRRLDLFDDSLDATQQRHIRNLGQIALKRFAEGSFHARRVRRWNTFLRVVSGDFSPA
jgi:hypothetical protein